MRPIPIAQYLNQFGRVNGAKIDPPQDGAGARPRVLSVPANPPPPINIDAQLEEAAERGRQEGLAVARAEFAAAIASERKEWEDRESARRLAWQANEFARFAEKIDRATEYRILDAFMMRQIEAVDESWLLDVPLQPRPAVEPRFACDGELGIAELQVRTEDFGVGRMMESGMKLPDALRYLRRARSMSSQQVLRLMFEVIEIGIGREWSYRHDELPFVRPRSALTGRKSVRKDELF